MHSKNQKRHSSPVPSRSPLVPMKPKGPAVAPAVAPSPSPGVSLPFRVPKDYPHSRFSKAPLAVYPPKGARNKTCVSLPVVTLEKMPCLSRADSSSHVRLTASSLIPSASQRSSEKLTNGRGAGGPPTPRSTTPPSSLDRRPSPARSPLDKRPSSTPSPSQPDRKPSPAPLLSHRAAALASSSSSSTSALDKKQQNGTKTPSKSHKRLSGRVFDPNKHCGVQDPETKRSCTRSLTCKTHSLTHRRAVPGRRQNFDILLAEHKGRAKEGEKEKERDAAQESPSKPHCPNGRPLSTLKLRLANAHIPRAPGGSTTYTSTPLPPAPVPAPAPNPEPSPLSWVATAGDGGRLSSDEGEAETPEDADRPAFHYSHHHPQPLGLCVFSSRLMGRGHYVFDRRWDRMRQALQSMVEKHLNAQMWRKMPLASDGLLSSSCPSSVTSQHSSSITSPSDSPSYTATFSSVHGHGRSGQHPRGRGTRPRPHLFTGRRGLGRGGSGLWRSGDDWLSKSDGSQSLNSQSSLSVGTSSVPYSSGELASTTHQPLAPPPGPLAYAGGVEGRKRRSPGSYRGKASKLSKPGGLESLFGKGNDIGGILASGPESPRQAKLHH
ncbi:unnamed protein product [Pleuronectes platessa]|uniref:SCA7 domain-containing protein n=1 Tax=Pleuronectes platessa TaxID=8262 RepID=A0A9N7Y9N1_PLEPL|nr:unnamed protein product [Pleuronectes platessa]